MRILYFLVIGSVFFTSCYTPRYMYSPPAQNIPVLVNKGDSKLGAYLSTNLSNNNNGINESRNRGYDLQGAYAITNHLALAANYFKRTESNSGFNDGGSLDSSFIDYKRNLTEIGIGYFIVLDKNNQTMFQIFGGIGKGQFSFTDNGKQNNLDYMRSHQATITKFYIQPALMLRTKTNITFSFSSKFNFIKFDNIKTNYAPNELHYYKLDSLNDGTCIFWEPAFTNTFGFKNLPGVQLEYQFGFAIFLDGRYISHRAFNFSMALLLDLPKLLHPKSSQSKN